MTKRTRKRAAKAAREKAARRGRVGGVRPGSGPKPKLGAGNLRTVIKTVRLSTGEHEAQLASVKRSGAKDWAEWARGLLNLQARESARAAMVASVSLPPTPAVVDLHPDVAAGMQPVEVYPTQGTARAAVESGAVDSAVYEDRPTAGAVLGGTDPCVCGHAPEEHGHDPAHPSSTACRADLGAEGCDCAAYEAEPESVEAGESDELIARAREASRGDAP